MYLSMFRSMCSTGLAVHSFSKASIARPLNSSFFPWKYASSVETSFAHQLVDEPSLVYEDVNVHTEALEILYAYGIFHADILLLQ